MRDVDAASTFRDHLLILPRHRWLILAAAALGLSVSLAYAFTASKQYSATAQVLVLSSTDLNTAAMPVSQTDVQTDLALVTSAPVVRTVFRRFGVVPLASASEVGQTNVIAITAVSTKPTRAARVANAFARAYIAYQQSMASRNLAVAEAKLQREVSRIARQLKTRHGITANSPRVQALLNQQAVLRQQLAQLQVSGAVQLGGVELVTAAQAPASPTSPRPVPDGLLGLVAGALAGIAVAVLRESLDDRLTSEQATENAAGVPVLCAVPQVAASRKRKEPVVVSLDEPMSPASEVYRSLRTSLAFTRQERQIRSLVITSPLAGEGKTTLVANLGVVFAQAGEHVLMVSGDLRRPRLGEYFGLDEQLGLSSVLIGDRLLEDVIVPTSRNNRLWLVPAGSVPVNPAELLNSQRAQHIFGMLRDRFDLVLIDSPPVLPVTDAVVLARQADAALIVAYAGQTKGASLRRAADKLGQVNTTVIGTVLNQVTRQAGYGYGYGYGYKQYVVQAPAGEDASRRNGRATVPNTTP